MPVTVVTGAGSGIGAATRAKLIACGHTVIGVDLRNADISADLSTVQGRAEAIAAVLDRCGGQLDGLVCCAGLGPQVPKHSLIAAVNFFGVTAFLDGLFEALQRGQRPSAVVISSNSATLQSWAGHPMHEAFLKGDEAEALRIADELADGQTAYACSKNAITCHIRSLSERWGRAGVRLNAVAPGPIETPLLQAGLDDPRYGQAIKDFLPPLENRRGLPAEIAEVVEFLISPRASYVHGNMMFVDGGIDAWIRPRQF